MIKESKKQTIKPKDLMAMEIYFDDDKMTIPRFFRFYTDDNRQFDLLTSAVVSSNVHIDRLGGVKCYRFIYDQK